MSRTKKVARARVEEMSGKGGKRVKSVKPPKQSIKDPKSAKAPAAAAAAAPPAAAAAAAADAAAAVAAELAAVGPPADAEESDEEESEEETQAVPVSQSALIRALETERTKNAALQKQLEEVCLCLVHSISFIYNSFNGSRCLVHQHHLRFPAESAKGDPSPPQEPRKRLCQLELTSQSWLSRKNLVALCINFSLPSYLKLSPALDSDGNVLQSTRNSHR
jgi:hypothetical protein